MNFKFIIAISLLILISSIAEASGYIKRGSNIFSQVGFYDSKVQDAVYSIGYRGDKYSSNEEMNDFVLLRASEVASKEGYGYFIVSGRQFLGLDHSITIECFKENPKNISSLVYDAEQISVNLRSKYNIKAKT